MCIRDRYKDEQIEIVENKYEEWFGNFILLMLSFEWDAFPAFKLSLFISSLPSACIHSTPTAMKQKQDLFQQCNSLIFFCQPFNFLLQAFYVQLKLLLSSYVVVDFLLKLSQHSVILLLRITTCSLQCFFG
eukprot:TRINITY_DN26462_c0_g1_i1.p1 TRINITY_DN26462_c0_g1~~TRINITY_DN26462_c0_g1_i1.p1  ORF type:complete len:131 (-),score=11.04 TRINITY_DN26462_c0_g1_i1:22-414(-)